MADNTFYFYRNYDEGGFMSNFYFSSFVDDQGRRWDTAEAFFQAAKFDWPDHRHDARVERIRLAATPADAKRIGQRRGGPEPIRPDWEDVKYDVMLQALRFKFSQNPELRGHLLATSPRSLVEHSPPRGSRGYDTVWADGHDGSGANLLGQALMEVRGGLGG